MTVYLTGATSGETSAAKTDPVSRSQFPRVKLAAATEFPREKLVPIKGGLSRRIVTSSVTHPPGYIVELLYDAVEGAQIRDPLSGRMRWVHKPKLGPFVDERHLDEPKAKTDYPARIVTTSRPVRFPLRRHDGRYFGDTAIPAGERIRITAEKEGYIRAETRDLAGWVKREALEVKTDRPLTALSNPPAPIAESSASPTPAPPPIDVPPASIPFKTSDSHNYVELVPFTLTAEVLGWQKYPMPGQKGGFWSTEVQPVDLALAWGPYLGAGKIAVRMGYRSANFRHKELRAMLFSGNFHVAVDAPAVRKKLLAIRVGDVVRLNGALIRLEHPRGKANPADSTITGAYCYTILCRAVEKLPAYASTQQ